MWDYLTAPALLVVIGASITAVSSFALPDGKSRKALVFLGTALSIAGGFWASGQQAISQHENQQKSEEIVQAQKDLKLKSEEIVELNKQIVAAVTGGDSFAYIRLVFIGRADTTPRLTLIHQGKYPLYELDYRIVDLVKMEKENKHYSLDDLTKDQKNIGNIGPNQARVLDTVQIGSEPIRWNLFFGARNGFFVELLRMRRVGDEWKTAIRVDSRPTSGEEAKTLFKLVEPGYPLGKDGQVDWQ